MVMVALVRVACGHLRRASGPLLCDTLLFVNVTFCFTQVAWIGVLEVWIPKKFLSKITSITFSTMILPLPIHSISFLLKITLVLFSSNIFHLSRDSNVFPIISSIPSTNSVLCT